MHNLLLITDVPRLGKIFGRLADDPGISVRIASSLETGAEEIAADKPAMIFMQTHLAGLSADILLMHFKKRLQRKRSRFVLLSAPGEVNDATVRLFHGHIDTSLDEESMLAEIRRLLETTGSRRKPAAGEARPAREAAVAPPRPVKGSATPPPVSLPELPDSPPPLPPEPPEHEQPAEMETTAGAAPEETTSLVEQGITYEPRTRLKVYSEFTGSFNSAVDSMLTTAPPGEEPPRPQPPSWRFEQPETGRPATDHPRRRFFSFLFWLVPVLFIVLAVTLLQNRTTLRKRGEAVQEAAPKPPPAQSPPAPVVPVRPPAAGALKRAAGDTPAPNPPASGGTTPPAAASGPSAQNASRLTRLPDVVPRYGYDKKYSAANPGWERYMGQVTEFRILREREYIKTIQVIDRGGDGVPESFMRAVLRQVAKHPSFVQESSEKKEGYEIQRGHLSPDIRVVFYRDEQGGRLRAFVMTWR